MTERGSVEPHRLHLIFHVFFKLFPCFWVFHKVFRTVLSCNIIMEMCIRDSNMTMPGLESGLKGTMYMQDQIVYMDMMGQKFKMDASNEIAAAMNMDTSQLLDISEDMISDITMSEDGSDTVYNIKMDGNKALDYLEKNAGNVQGMAGATRCV